MEPNIHEGEQVPSDESEQKSSELGTGADIKPGEEAIADSRDVGEEELHARWGENYEANGKAVAGAAKWLFDSSNAADIAVRNLVADSELGNDPDVLEALAKIPEHLGPGFGNPPPWPAEIPKGEMMKWARQGASFLLDGNFKSDLARRLDPFFEENRDTLLPWLARLGLRLSAEQPEPKLSPGAAQARKEIDAIRKDNSHPMHAGYLRGDRDVEAYLEKLYRKEAGQ